MLKTRHTALFAVQPSQWASSGECDFVGEMGLTPELGLAGGDIEGRTPDRLTAQSGVLVFTS